jgi:hypothetical protein
VSVHVHSFHTITRNSTNREESTISVVRVFSEGVRDRGDVDRAQGDDNETKRNETSLTHLNSRPLATRCISIS